MEAGKDVLFLRYTIPHSESRVYYADVNDAGELNNKQMTVGEWASGCRSNARGDIGPAKRWQQGPSHVQVKTAAGWVNILELIAAHSSSMPIPVRDPVGHSEFYGTTEFNAVVKAGIHSLLSGACACAIAQMAELYTNMVAKDRVSFCFISVLAISMTSCFVYRVNLCLHTSSLVTSKVSTRSASNRAVCRCCSLERIISGFG